MQLDWDEHFTHIVLPAWQDHLHAAGALSEASRSGNAAWRRAASYTALRHGASAVIFLHHFAEVVLRSAPPFLPNDASEVGRVRRWLRAYCFKERATEVCDDVALLGDVADALKHAVLTHRVDARRVSTTGEVLVVLSPEHGDAADGRATGAASDEVVVLTGDHARSLSSVLQNVIDAWRRAVGMPLPDIGVA